MRQAWLLQYYEALMLLCEQLGCSNGGAIFAQAAISQVPTRWLYHCMTDFCWNTHGMTGSTMK